MTSPVWARAGFRTLIRTCIIVVFVMEQIGDDIKSVELGVGAVQILSQ